MVVNRHKYFFRYTEFFSELKKMGFRGSLRSEFDKTIDQSNVNGFSLIKKIYIEINYPHLVEGLNGPPSLPQELEVGGRRPPYLLVFYTLDH